MIYDGDTMGIFGIPLMECDHPYFFWGAFFYPRTNHQPTAHVFL